MAETRLQDVIFYSLESAIKAYRRFAQSRLDAAGIDITVDQGMVLKTIHDSPDITLQQVGVVVFKDFASVTRIVQLLEQKGLLRRKPHPTDGRRSKLLLTTAGESVIRASDPIAQANRRHALKGISAEEVERLRTLLKRITENCDAEGAI
jgi:DNA-binding MarR family transcriptional regulator